MIGRRYRGFQDSLLKYSLTLAAGALVLALAALACGSEPPATADAPSLTQPPPATATPVVVEPTATPTDPIAATATLPPPSATPAPTVESVPPTVEIPGSGSTPSVSETVAGLEQLLEVFLRPRTINAEFVWAFLISEHALALGQDTPEAGEVQVKMLQMWSPEDVCFGQLQAEVAALGPNNQVDPITYRQYLEYIDAELEPCIAQQLPLVDAQAFFALPVEERSDRIAAWFRASWPQGDPASAHCDAVFDARVPTAATAGTPQLLGEAWTAALGERFQCQFELMNRANEFLDLGDSHLFTLESEERKSVIGLQTRLTGHVLAMGLGRQYGDCWPDFEAEIPLVAEAGDPSQLSLRSGTALESLYACVEQLPITNPFMGQ